MFCVVYQWKVKPGMSEQFRETWRTITAAIYRQHGSLGSRLHQAEDGSFIAYAQWPDREHWEKHGETVGVEAARSQQRACIEHEPAVLARLTVTDDMLERVPF